MNNKNCISSVQKELKVMASIDVSRLVKLKNERTHNSGQKCNNIKTRSIRLKLLKLTNWFAAFGIFACSKLTPKCTKMYEKKVVLLIVNGIFYS